MMQYTQYTVNTMHILIRTAVYEPEHALRVEGRPHAGNLARIVHYALEQRLQPLAQSVSE